MHLVTFRFFFYFSA
ncbi:pheST operon leader peptide PheM [Yersinia massiliensis]|nr:pheST operon leader peptide PheM [Yersinia massiliensis]